MSRELQVVAEALYIARLSKEWITQPYWVLRRCIVPYVSTGQFITLRRDNIPVAFAGWAFDRPGKTCPWQKDHFFPSAHDLSGTGECFVTELISPLLPKERVLQEVANWLKLDHSPSWVERDANRKVIAVHKTNLTSNPEN